MKDPSDSKIPCPSPKSIYRLADKVCTSFVNDPAYPVIDIPSPEYEVSALKTRALNQICGGLGKCDIVGQSFSKFASQ